MRAALRRRYSGVVGADPGKRPSVLLEHAGAWAYSLRSPSAVEGSLVFRECLGTRKVELLAESEDSFAALNVSVKFKFLRSTDGKVIGFNRIVVERSECPSPAESSEHAGKISDQPLPFNKVEYTRQEVMIPVRAGIKLHAVILRPKDYTTPLPFLMEPPPYGVDGNTPESINPRQPELAASRYIFVFEDIRGRFKSEGPFAMNRPMADHRDPKIGRASCRERV